MNGDKKLTEMLGIQYPIVQAPMLGVTSPEMVAAVSNGGGLGSLPLGGLAAGVARKLIHQTKALTNKPFAVNLFTYTIPAIAYETAESMALFLKEICTINDLNYTKPDLAQLQFHSYEELIPVLLDENIPIVSFTFGCPDDAAIAAFKSRGVKLIGTVTSVEEAVFLAEKGIDMLTVQGIEAGGHRGSFLSETIPQTGLFTLLPQIADVVSLPLLAAGGIYDQRTIAAAHQLGASGVQIGSLFITANESLASDLYKSSIMQASETGTVLTRAVTGRWLRALRNRLIDLVESSGQVVPAYPVQGSLTAPIRSLAQAQGIADFFPMLAGQACSRAVKQSAAEILSKLVDAYR
jgi:nitronate monooxygenase